MPSAEVPSRGVRRMLNRLHNELKLPMNDPNVTNAMEEIGVVIYETPIPTRRLRP